MMDPSETDNFRNQWRKALENASEPPPPSVWEGIEARLDRDEKDIIPLWWRRPRLWYAAASVIALLLVAGGVWVNQFDSVKELSGTSSGVATTHKTSPQLDNKLGSEQTSDAHPGVKPENANEEAIAAVSEQPKMLPEKHLVVKGRSTKEVSQKHQQNGEIHLDTKNSLAETKQDIGLEDKNILRETSDALPSVKPENAKEGAIAAVSEQPKMLPEKRLVVRGISRKEVSQKHQQNGEIHPDTKSSLAEAKQDLGLENKNILREKEQPGREMALFEQSKSLTQMGNVQAMAPVASNENSALAVHALTPVSYSELDVFMPKRYIFFKPETLKEEPLPEIKKRSEYYAGVGVMPASFNPNVQIKDAPVAFASMQNNSRHKALTGTNKPGNSFALQTQGGMRLSKHWSLEMGVSYLKGNAKYEGGGQVLDAVSARPSNVLENALIGLADKHAIPNSPSYGGSVGMHDMYASSIYLDVNRNVNNNYQYLQLPVQAGFTLNPDKKLSYSVLGGMMANFFLSNELEAASGNMIKTTPGDDVYRSMNWAATTGLRFNYKLSAKWKANLTGSYQKAISSGFKANQSLESHPFLYGVSWGVRYSF